MAANQQRWRARPLVARGVGVGVFVIPVLASSAGVLLINELLPPPSSFVQRLAHLGALIAGGVAPLPVAIASCRRLLPLSTLLRLQLAFPDKAPSRYEIAKRAHRTRDLKHEVDMATADGSADTRLHAASMVLALVVAVGDHDRATRGHSERVRVFADMIGDEIGLSEEDKEKLRWAALLHDVGKLSVPSEILNKPGRPDEEEWDILKRHPLYGVHIVDPLRSWLGAWIGAVEQHHERFDGRGYPRGLSGTNISLGGRLVGVADSFEVMTAARAYKHPMPVKEARQELVQASGKHFDPDVVRAFLGISVGRLRGAIGLGALLAQIPLVAQLSYRGLPERLGRAAGTVAATAGLLGALSVGGIVQLGAFGWSPGDGLPTAAADSMPKEVGEDRSRDETGSTVPEDRTRSDPGGAGTTRDVVAPREVEPNDPPDSGGEGNDDPPPPKDDPSPSAPMPYVAYGRIEAPAPGSRVGATGTESEFRVRCGVPASQGVDAWIFSLPDRRRTGSAIVRSFGGIGGEELEARLYTADCSPTGAYSGTSRLEGMNIPVVARYMVVASSTGGDMRLRVEIDYR